MGAAASLQEAAETDLPELVPRSQAETLLGTTLENHNEWRLHADAEDRVPRATLRSACAVTAARVEAAETFYQSLKEFYDFRKDAAALWERQPSRDALETLEPVNKAGDREYDETAFQQSVDGHPCQTIKALYEAAALCKPAFEHLMFKIQREASKHDEGEPELKLAPLKGVARAQEKARFDYGDRPHPISWVCDIVRGCLIVETPQAARVAFDALSNHDGVDIVKSSNRFKYPTPAGFRDVNVKMRLDPQKVAGSALGSALDKKACPHVVEAQIHLRPLKKFAVERDSHRFYEHFRSFFRGDWEQIEAQAQALERLFQRGSGSSLLSAVDELVADDQASASLTSSVAELVGQLGLHDKEAVLCERLAELEHKERRLTHVGVAHLRRGNALLAQGACKDAADAFRIAGRKLNNKPMLLIDAKLGQGRSLVGLGDLAGGEKVYTKTLNLLGMMAKNRICSEEAVGPVHVAKAHLLAARGEYDDAFAELAKAEKLLLAFDGKGDESPNLASVRAARADVLLRRAQALERLGDQTWSKLVNDAYHEANAAAEVLHKVCGERAKETATAFSVKAKVLVRQGKYLGRGKYLEAEEPAAKACACIADTRAAAAARATYAAALEGLGRTGDASAERRKATDALRAGQGGADMVDLLLAEAEALKKQGHGERAAEAAAEAVRAALDPRDVVRARQESADILSSLNKHDAAAAELDAALDAATKLLGKVPTPAEDLTPRSEFDTRFEVTKKMLAHPRAITEEMALLYRTRGITAEDRGRADNAVKFYGWALELFRAHDGDDKPFVAELAGRHAKLLEKFSARKARPPRPRSGVKDRPRSGTQRPKSGTRRPHSAAKYRPKSATKQPPDGTLDDLARELCALRQPSR
ncbi:unnamed protein product [Pelagomonas calceolata]|uniref:Uncharacterized protein n=1 Tax=Pelagomonas calceolata TaxID=35677 RepID=A0A8J2S697_9STRA|nr:unnamed protein product [Pelagomonas calceolata]|mmetsp:Transcript_3123/g.8958  ORF Transcript_3123/g.8958 Transcript_3123/m.8958 type:complete len:877 (-) Transcript_3123:915-3545(-)